MASKNRKSGLTAEQRARRITQVLFAIMALIMIISMIASLVINP